MAVSCRFYIPPTEAVLAPGMLPMPAATARHAKVLRLAVGQAVSVFDGTGGEWVGELLDSHRLQLREHLPIEREAHARVMLAIGMPANERMDALVEKAVELGVSAIQPLITRRSVLRLQGERAQRRVAHWQGVAIAACEQCGRNRVPVIAQVATLADWLERLSSGCSLTQRCLLSPTATTSLQPFAPGETGWMVSGPEGGLDEEETAMLLRFGFHPVSLGPRVLRADTAPLVALMRAAGG